MEVKTLPSDSEDEEDEFLKGREYLKGPPPNVKNKELNQTSFGGKNLWSTDAERVAQKNEILSNFQKVIQSAD